MAPGQKTMVSSDGGIHPRWRSDGRELFYWVPPRGIMSVPMTFTADGFRAGTPVSIVSTPPLTLIDGRTHYDVTPDGRRFLLRQPVETTSAPAATIVVNWPELLKK
jgi:hypothetical protein